MGSHSLRAPHHPSPAKHQQMKVKTQGRPASTRAHERRNLAPTFSVPESHPKRAHAAPPAQKRPQSHRALPRRFQRGGLLQRHPQKQAHIYTHLPTIQSSPFPNKTSQGFGAPQFLPSSSCTPNLRSHTQSGGERWGTRSQNGTQQQQQQQGGPWAGRPEGFTRSEWGAARASASRPPGSGPSASSGRPGAS